MTTEKIIERMKKLASENGFEFTEAREEEELQKLRTLCKSNGCDFEHVCEITFREGSYHVKIASSVEMAEDYMKTHGDEMSAGDRKGYKYQRDALLDDMHCIHLEIKEKEAKMAELEKEVDEYEALMYPKSLDDIVSPGLKCPYCGANQHEDYLVQRTAQGYGDGYTPYYFNHSFTASGKCEGCNKEYLITAEVSVEIPELKKMSDSE